MFWNKKPQEDKSGVEACAQGLYEALATALTQNGRIHVEDLISAAGAIVGERSIEAAGDFHARDHQYSPGQSVFSTSANVLFCGDKEIDESPADSVVGIFYKRVVNCGFTRSDFPASLKEIFTSFAANVGKAENWGKVPLSVPKENHPFIMPLRAAYETRLMADKIFAPLDNPRQKLHAAALTLAEAVCKTRDVLNRRVAITIALETANGMSKTAPMTDAAMAKVKAQQKA